MKQEAVIDRLSSFTHILIYFLLSQSLMTDAPLSLYNARGQTGWKEKLRHLMYTCSSMPSMTADFIYLFFVNIDFTAYLETLPHAHPIMVVGPQQWRL